MSCVLINASILTKEGTTIQHQAIAIENGVIVWCGLQKDLPDAYQLLASEIKDCHGKLITPGLIDCHTHLVYAGNRAHEFQLKLEGKSYEEIARAGGGIKSTVSKTRQASFDALFEESLPRLKALINEGVTTVEIKSGYGLDLQNELKMLKVARALGERLGIRIKTTFLGAHAVGPEFNGNSKAYVDYMCQEMIPAVKESQLADAVDVFCESIGFTLAETEQIFECAKAHNLPVKCHAEQLSNLSASELAAKYHALSSDHLEFIDERGVIALAKSNTVAVLLPGAFYFLREKRLPPIDLFRKHQVRMAIATDSNPGSSPTTSLLLMMNMACQLFGMTVPEALNAVTLHAAAALGLDKEIGSIDVGKEATLVLWDVTDAALLCYYVASPIAHQTMIAGRWV